jgi:hypothetical protein
MEQLFSIMSNHLCHLFLGETVTDQPNTHPLRKARSRLILLTAVVVAAASIGVALFFGETSPVIASGKVTLSDELTAQAQGMKTLYLIVRDAESPIPMPWGALVTTLGSDPSGTFYSFILTQDNLNIMNPGGALPKTISIKARLDMDGMGGADTPGDITGELKNITFGTQNIEITLNELVSETSDNTINP